MIHLDQQRLADSVYGLARITAVLFLVRVRNVMQHVRKEYAPSMAFIDTTFFPKPDIENTVLLAIGQPHADHFKGMIIGRCVGGNGKL